MKSYLVLVLFFLTGMAYGQKKSASGERFTIAFYNQENLFDTEDDPSINDEEFLPEGKNQWTPDRYRAKLDNMSRVISQLGDEDGPEVLGLCEIENRRVVEDLINTASLKDKGYGIVHFNSPDRRGIDVGLIYKKAVFSPTTSRSLRITFPGKPDLLSRDILMVSGTLKGEKITFFVNHWPSRRGGEESASSRAAAAQTARTVIDSLLKANPNERLILMGDFNDEPWDVSIQQVLKAVSIDSSAQSPSGYLLNAWGPLKKAGRGSHNYRQEWSALDQMILSPGLLKGKLQYVAGSADIYKQDWMLEASGKYAGSPFRTYAGAKYLGGFSDHLPVYLHLSLKK